jgi:hypothetical protein
MTGSALRFARMSTTAVFFYQGLIIASWASRIPQIKAASGLSDGLFGLALLGAPLASIAVMRPAARVIAKHGSKRLIRISMWCSPPLSGAPAMAANTLPPAAMPCPVRCTQRKGADDCQEGNR